MEKTPTGIYDPNKMFNEELKTYEGSMDRIFKEMED